MTTTSTTSPAQPVSRRGPQELWAAYQRRMAYGQPLIGIRAWPFLDWRLVGYNVSPGGTVTLSRRTGGFESSSFGQRSGRHR